MVQHVCYNKFEGGKNRDEIFFFQSYASVSLYLGESRGYRDASRRCVDAGFYAGGNAGYRKGDGEKGA